jgi:hypothetical protein
MLVQILKNSPAKDNTSTAVVSLSLQEKLLCCLRGTSLVSDGIYEGHAETNFPCFYLTCFYSTTLLFALFRGAFFKNSELFFALAIVLNSTIFRKRRCCRIHAKWWLRRWCMLRWTSVACIRAQITTTLTNISSVIRDLIVCVHRCKSTKGVCVCV